MRFRWRVALTVMLTWTCVSIAVGDDVTAPGCNRQGIYVFRGFVGYWPDAFGMAARMSHRGYRPHVYRSRDVSLIKPELLVHRGQSSAPPIYLIGYSYGASAAVSLAEDLMEYGMTVDRMVLIECYDHPVIPCNVKYCVNLYESRRLDRVQPFRGTPARAADPSSTMLIDIDIAYTPGWEEVRESNSHFTIADDPQLQDFVAQQFPNLMPPIPGTGTGTETAKAGFLALRPEMFGVSQNNPAPSHLDPHQNGPFKMDRDNRAPEFPGQGSPYLTQQASNDIPTAEAAAIIPPPTRISTVAAPVPQVWSPAYGSANSNYRAMRPGYVAPRPQPPPVVRSSPYTSYRKSVSR